MLSYRVEVTGPWWIALFIFGCQPDCGEGFAEDVDGDCVPDVDTSDSVTLDSQDTGTPLGYAYGDPIEVVRHQTEMGESNWHFLDVVALDEELVLVAGQGGLGVLEIESAQVRWGKAHQRIYDLAWDPSLEQAYMGTRLDRIDVMDLGDRDQPMPVGTMLEWLGYHEDIAADEGRVLVAAPQTGAVLLDGASLTMLSTIEASWASAVGLHGDLAVVGDADEIVLYDLAAPEEPLELDRVAVRATARDIAFDGEHLAVALGGHGVAVIELVDDTLVLRNQLDLPGPSYGVALDGDELWVSAWSEVALIGLGTGEPLLLGSEPVPTATSGLAARGGRAVAADWFELTTFVRHEGLAGPELLVPETAWSDGDDPPTATVKLSNLGAMTLEVSLSVQDPAISVSTDLVVLEPGETDTVSVSGETGSELRTQLDLVTNDPDETEVAIALGTGDQSVGLPHEELELQGFVYPDTNLAPYRLSEQTGRVVFLAYFSLY